MTNSVNSGYEPRFGNWKAGNRESACPVFRPALTCTWLGVPSPRASLAGGSAQAGPGPAVHPRGLPLRSGEACKQEWAAVAKLHGDPSLHSPGRCHSLFWATFRKATSRGGSPGFSELGAGPQSNLAQAVRAGLAQAACRMRGQFPQDRARGQQAGPRAPAGAGQAVPVLAGSGRGLRLRAHSLQGPFSQPAQCLREGL